ncbi:hypothetical protein FOCC_FOCC013172, partial [Frankliniella occidentalis]
MMALSVSSGSESPSALVAVTRNLYSWPGSSPVTSSSGLSLSPGTLPTRTHLPVAVSIFSTSYWRMGEPPSSSGGSQCSFRPSLCTLVASSGPIGEPGLPARDDDAITQFVPLCPQPSTGFLILTEHATRHSPYGFLATKLSVVSSGSDSPSLLTALTRSLYFLPFVSPVTLNESASGPTSPAGTQRPPVTSLPPLSSGFFHLTVACWARISSTLSGPPGGVGLSSTTTSATPSTVPELFLSTSLYLPLSARTARRTVSTVLRSYLSIGSLARIGLANVAGSDDPILLTARILNLYSRLGVRSSHLNTVGAPGFTSPTLSQPPFTLRSCRSTTYLTSGAPPSSLPGFHATMHDVAKTSVTSTSSGGE